MGKAAVRKLNGFHPLSLRQKNLNLALGRRLAGQYKSSA
jgi:hypothetical protein